MKHLLSSAVTSALLITVAACSGGSNPLPEYIEVNEQDIEICCDPNQGAPGRVGDIDIFINENSLAFLDPATIEAEIRYTGTVGTSARLDVVSTASLPLGHTTIGVFLDDCDFTEIEISMEISARGVRLDNRVPFTAQSNRTMTIRNLCPPTPVIPPQRIAEAVLGTQIPNFGQFMLATPTGVLAYNSNLSLPPRIPDAKTETFQIGVIVVDLDQAQIEAAFTGPGARFPAGDGPHGRTLVPEQAVPMVPGRYMLTWQCVQEAIPLQDPVKSFQYSFVADRDLSAANNYFGQAPYLGDYWDNTDTQFAAEYTPISGWRFRTFRSQAGSLQATTSGARVILSDQVNFFVLPYDEFGSPSPAEMDGRYTTFCHEGDYGQTGGPWSGDPTPPVGEPLIRFGWQLSF